MFKKLIVTGAAVALMLGSAAGAFAAPHHSLPTTLVTITNEGSVSNSVDTSANTGFNSVTGGSVSGSSILTGAASAGSNVQSQLNWNQFGLPTISGTQNITFSLVNSGMVGNEVSTSANSGYNDITAGGMLMNFSSENNHHSHGMSGVTNSSITTGAANASSVVSNVVNTNMFGSTSL
jgi:hypothetical protein